MELIISILLIACAGWIMKFIGALFKLTLEGVGNFFVYLIKFLFILLLLGALLS